MQKAEPQHRQTQQHQPAAKQAKAASVESPQGEHIAQLEAIMDSSPQAEKLGGLAAMMNASPAMVAQRKLADMMHNSPRQAAQRKKFDNLFGTVQRVGEEEPLQGKFTSDIKALVAGEFAQAVQGKADPRMLEEVSQRVQSEMATGKFIVDDKAVPGPGQMNKSLFLSALRAHVRQMAEQVLAKIGQNADDCPYIPHWFDYYGEKDVAHIEEAISRYAPSAMTAADWQGCIAKVAEQVRLGFEKHVSAGSMEGVPEGMPQIEHPKAEGEKTAADTLQLQPVLQACGSVPREQVAPQQQDDPEARAKAAANAYVDGLPDDTLAALRLATVEETAQSEAVQDHLITAMTRYAAQYGDNAPLYADETARATFGTNGSCMRVAPVFARLLNRIHQTDTCVEHVTNPNHADDSHYTVRVGTSYIDPTWRQGARRPQDAHITDAEREGLPMVRVSNVPPTMREISAAVRLNIDVARIAMIL